MGCAEVISLSEVRARKQWDGLRQELHARFDQWLDDLEARLPEPEVTLSEVSDSRMAAAPRPHRRPHRDPAQPCSRGGAAPQASPLSSV